MSIFDVHSKVLGDCRDFVRSFFTVAGDRACWFVKQTIHVVDTRLFLGREPGYRMQEGQRDPA